MADEMFTQAVVENFDGYAENEPTLEDACGLVNAWEAPEVGTSQEDGTQQLFAAFTRDERCDALAAWAESYTELHPASTVRIREEWIGDGGPTITELVCGAAERAGERGTFSHQMPDNISGLRFALEVAQADFERFESTTGEHAMALALSNAAASLVVALKNVGL